MLAKKKEKEKKTNSGVKANVGSPKMLEHQWQGLRQLVHGRVLEPAEPKDISKKK